MSDTITLIGNIATEPIFKTTPGGMQILSFRLATNERRFDEASKTWIDGEANWYSVSVFRKLAQHASASLRKGERVIVKGRLRLRRWESDGRQGIAAEINADSIGHDLLFGTTVFTRTAAARPTTGGSGSDHHAGESRPAQEGDAWATRAPGESEEGPGWSTPLQDSGQAAPDPVGVGSGIEDTPF